METTDEAWYRHAFAADYVRIYQHRDQEEAARSVRALLSMVALPPGAVCLDVCCGFGRHLAALNRAGWYGMGVDLSADLLRRASANPHVAGRIVRGDMRSLPFARHSVHGVFSFFTSFGYFADEAENAAVVQEYARVLRPDGRLLIDFLNAAQVRRELVAEDEQRFPDFTLHQRRWIEEEPRIVAKELTLTDAAGSRTYHERVKLYGLADFEAFFAAAGLNLEQVAGDYDGSPHTESSPRLIMICRRH